MKQMDRRRFVVASAATAASWKSFAQNFPASHGPSPSGPAPQLARPPAPEGPVLQTATLVLHTDQPGPFIPPNFVGLSYETQQLSDPAFFSPANTGLVAQFRALAPAGVLRLGGNTSDYGFWKPTPDAVPPPRAKRPYKIGDPPPDLTYNVTPEAIRSLRGFLDATDWKCIYGINLGTNTPELAADEAAFVSKTLGPRLHYFQVGNEADRFGSTIRDPKTWNADTYFDEWLTFANAIRARMLDAHFGLPDTAGNPEWYAVVVTRLLALPEHDRPYIAALTHHYYFTGPPSNPKATIDNLLHADPHVDKLASDIRAAAARLTDGEHRTVLYRMTEGNTCFRGGKPGLSDVFAASLWAADYLLLLASLGYAGVNLHGGQPRFVAESLGGTLPGDELLADPKAPHPRPSYTPIAEIDGKYTAEPVSFGMRFAQQFAGATIIPHDFDPGPANATAYAAKFPDGRTLAAIINKDPMRNLEVTIEGDWVISETLTADSLTSTNVKLSAAQGKQIVPAASAAIFSPATRPR
ncbi:MAG: hypothetical protein ABSG84_06600 [Acidobacteriaceae bacterium]|jgi:hypothetical protein